MRLIIRLAIGAAVFVLASMAPAWAAYPDKPIRILVGFPAGSAGDLLARSVGQKLGERLGQPVLVENRTGAGSSIAAEAVAKAPADGYTLLLSTSANVINQSVSSNLKFDFTRDLAPVMLIGENPVVLIGVASTAPRSIAALVARAKALPDRMTYASSGNGTFTHLYGELFKLTTGVKITHVPYRGSVPAMTDLLAGVVDLSFTPVTPVMAHIKSGRLKALAVIGKSRMAALPEVPTFAEAGIPGFDSALWFGLSAPAGTPPAVIDQLNTELRLVLKMPDVKSQLDMQGITIVADGPAKFRQLIAREHGQWTRIVKAADIKAE
ncbi:tripartite tricarboxylate transporter substrate binding protein [Variovorax terrae]|uniref:Tripartite tricarboxylate transporter substrate binding protein n=1 Tax=Variovorax terrae TaxID=2923278 RepID=A0A9X1VX68_9BURK|nr:tripartite tricarboxylate transporter substrate binding protein [Variovorax terrae]MCJ0764893.1 tripartite tricarboxylate transporter substrate binding protein [Variovorax terrae]